MVTLAREFTCVMLQIRKDYYEERVHAGPQSKILEGMTWEEAQAAKVTTQIQKERKTFHQPLCNRAMNRLLNVAQVLKFR